MHLVSYSAEFRGVVDAASVRGDHPRYELAAVSATPGLSLSPCIRSATGAAWFGAARVITVSHATRRDLEGVLRISGRTPFHHLQRSGSGFHHRARRSGAAAQILDRYSITYPYILYAGTVRVHKNVPRLVEAFAVLRHKLENHPVYRDLRLVIIGDELSKNPAVRRAVAHSRIESAVRFLGFVPIETLRVFYCAAEVSRSLRFMKVLAWRRWKPWPAGPP